VAGSWSRRITSQCRRSHRSSSTARRFESEGSKVAGRWHQPYAGPMPTCTACGEANSDRARFCQACGHPLTDREGSREVRRLVTVLFCDVIGSTAFARGLDPESLHGVFSKYFAEMRGAVERHGGVVEKFIGDAVMAVFGLPKAHEDDAWRAVKAAHEMRMALAPLNEELERSWGVSIATRIGVNTGVVVAGGSGGALVTGEPVIVAARLEQVATPGDILLGPETFRLVRDLVEAEPMDDLVLKGLERPIDAYRLLEVTSAASTHRVSSPLVGRRAELATLRATFERAKEGSRCELVVVLGQAGVGKTRLIEEFLVSCGDEPVVFTGQCLPYGEGITFWPLTEVLTEAAGLSDADTPEIIRHKIGLLLAGVAIGPRVAERVAQAIGVAGGSAAPDETLWAIRTLFEHLARSRPLILVFRGFQHAETTFLGLIEHIADRARDAPILLVCEGRGESARLRNAVLGRPNAGIVRVNPLATGDAVQLIDNLLGSAELTEDVRRRIVEVAGGLPLYAEEIISMLVDEGHLRQDGDRWIPAHDLSSVPIPSTIRALLSTRLDGLSVDERVVIDRASIVGMRFDDDEIEVLSPPAIRPRLVSLLGGLASKGFIRSARSTTPGMDTFEFHHILYREVTYESLAKHERAELHERYAGWLESWAGERIEEFEEIVAHHLDQSVRLRHELGRPDQRSRDLSERAGRRYASAGRRASERGDSPATVALLTRAVDLIPVEDRDRVELMPLFVDALLQTGDLIAASSIAGEMALVAAGLGDPSLEAKAGLTSSLVRSITEPGAESVEEFRRLAADAVEIFEASGEMGDLGSAVAELAWTHGMSGEAEKMLELSERAMRLAADPLSLRDAAEYFGHALLLGPTPAQAAVGRIEAVRADLSAHQALDASIRLFLAELLGMMKDFDAAFAHVREAREVFEDLGQQRWLAVAEGTAGLITWWSGAPEAAEADFRSCYAFNRDEGGEIWGREAARFARLLLELGRVDEADEVAAIVEQGTSRFAVEGQVAWRSVRARTRAALGDTTEGLRLAHEAVGLAEQTDFVSQLATALLDLIECQRRAGGPGEQELAERAWALFERKGDEVGASSARATQTTRTAATTPRSPRIS
jgi:class 3 adenylate cyclase